MQTNRLNFVHKLPENSKRIFEDGKRLSSFEENENEPTKDLVSIVTACLNASQTIQQTIHSISTQTYPHIEHIVIDGGSIDGTLNILKENIEYLDYVVSEPNTGRFNALNKGITLARGEYVIILNAGDQYEAETVESLVLAIKHSYADFVSVRTKIIDESGVCIERTKSVSYDSSMYFGEPISHGLMLLPRQLYAKVEGYNENYLIAAGFDLMLRLFDAGCTFYEVPKFFLNFQLTSFSNNTFKGIHKEHADIIKKQFSFISDKNVKILANEKELTQKSVEKIASLYQDKPKLILALWAYANRRKIQADNLKSIVDRIIKPDISIIIPVFNSQHVVDRCVQSILSQADISFEVIIIDDKSMDKSHHILQALKENDSRIKIFYNTQNLGAAGSRNIGIEKAKGRYIFFVDSDDEIPRNSLSKLYNAACKYDSNIVKGNMAYFPELSGKSQLKGYKITKEFVNVTVKDIPELLKTTEGHATCLYQTEFIKNNPYPVNLTMGEDSLFLLKAILRAEKITLLPIVVYHYINNSISATNSYTLQQYIDECHWRLSAFYLLKFYDFGEIGHYLIRDYWNEPAFSKLSGTLSADEYTVFANSYLELVRKTKVFPNKNNLNIPKTSKLFANIIESYGSQINKILSFKAKSYKPKKGLKLAMISTAVTGGAGIAAKRLFDALLRNKEFLEIDLYTKQNGFITSNCFPQDQLVNNKYTNTYFSLEKSLHPQNTLTTSEQNFIEDLKKYDAINIHWSADFTSLRFLMSLVDTGKPIIFTLHDYWMFTGGCHFPAGCQNYVDSGCKHCPQIKKDLQLQKLVQQSLKIKHNIFTKQNVFVIAPSKFLLNELKKCSLLDVEKRTFMIRNPYIPLSISTMTERKPKSFVLICDAHKERRKGFDLACRALKIVIENHSIDAISVSVVGEITERDRQKLNHIKNITYFGKISDHRKIHHFFETHEFILQSSFEDNWPNVLVEAGVAGCIAIVTPNHGCEEFVKIYETHGLVSQEVSAQSYAATINKALDTTNKELSLISTRLREFVCKEHQHLRASNSFHQVIEKAISTCKKKLNDDTTGQNVVHAIRERRSFSYYTNKLNSKVGWRVQENELSFMATILGLMSHYETLVLEFSLLLNGISGIQATEVNVELISHKKNEKKQAFSLNQSRLSGIFTVERRSVLSFFTRKEKNAYGIVTFTVKSINQ